MESRTIKLIAGGLALGGTASIALLFVFAMNTKAPEKDKRWRANVAELAPGRFIALDTGALRYFVVRTIDGELYVLAVPTVEGAVPMPQNYWWQPVIRCKNFGLDTNAEIVTADARFRCRDPDQPEEWSKRWQWDTRGRHIPDSDNTPIDDMYRMKAERSGDEIVVTGMESV